MGTLKGEKGFNVQSLASDPVQTAAWSTGGAMNTGRNQYAGLGIVTAAMVCGGADDPAGFTSNTETYDGTTWTETTNLPITMGHQGSAGTEAAGLVIGGFSSPPGVLRNTCLTWNGSAYGASPSLGTAIKQGGSCGTQTAALYNGGEQPALTAQTEEFNGVTWSAGGAMVSARNNNRDFGVQTDAVTVGGSVGGAPAVWLAETYNGTGWTVGNLLNTGREGVGNPGGGTASTAGLVAGGSVPGPGEAAAGIAAEKYNGSTWTTITSLSNRRSTPGGTVSPSTSYMVQGGTPGYITSSEVYSENSEPNTFVVEGQVWYNSTSSALKFFDGTDIKTITTS